MIMNGGHKDDNDDGTAPNKDCFSRDDTEEKREESTSGKEVLRHGI